MGKGHHLYIVNYYTSISLAEYFIENDTYVTGTVSKIREHFTPALRKIIFHKAYFHHDIMEGNLECTMIVPVERLM